MASEKQPPLSPERLAAYDRQVMKSNLVSSLGHGALYGGGGAFIGAIAGSIINIFYQRIDYEIGVFMGFIVVFVMSFLTEYEKLKRDAIKYRKENYE